MPPAESFLARIARFAAQHLLRGRHWQWRVILVCILAAVVSAPPHVLGLSNYLKKPRLVDPPAERRADYDQWDAISIKIQHPLADMEQYFSPEKQQAKRTFRFTVPFIAHLLHLQVRGAILLNVLTGPLLFAAVLLLAARLGLPRFWALILSLGTASLHYGHAFANELSGAFDATPYALLILAMAVRNPFGVAGLTVLIGYCDERALIASSAILCFHLLPSSTAQQFSLSRIFTPLPLSIIAGWIICLGSRIAIARSHQLPVLNAAGANLLFSSYTFGYGYLSFFSSWKCGMALVPVGVVQLWTRHFSRLLLLMIVGGMALVCIASLEAFDHTRGLSYAVPFFFVILAALLRSGANRREMRNVLWPCSLLSLLLPNFTLRGEMDFAQSWVVQVLTLINQLKSALH